MSFVCSWGTVLTFVILYEPFVPLPTPLCIQVGSGQHVHFLVTGHLLLFQTTQWMLLQWNHQCRCALCKQTHWCHCALCKQYQMQYSGLQCNHSASISRMCHTNSPQRRERSPSANVCHLRHWWMLWDRSQTQRRRYHQGSLVGKS